MIYTVYCVNDDETVVLHSPVSQDHVLINPVLTLEVNKTGTLTFQIPQNHPEYSKLRKMESEIVVYEGQNKLWAGRALSCEINFYNIETVTCEGIMGYLLDSQMPPFVNQAGISSFLTALLNNHNTRVGSTSKKAIQLGNVTVTDDNDYIYRASEDYNSTLDLINEKLIDKLGGYLFVREESGGRYLDYLATAPQNEQTISFGENLIDMTRFIDSNELCTAVIPIGADYEVTTGSGETEETTTYQLDIKTYQQTQYHPSGADYVFDPDMVERFGYIYKVVEFSDVTIQSHLYEKAVGYLQSSYNLVATINLTAVDLSLLNTELDAFRIGDSVTVISIPHGINQTYMVEAITYDLANPVNSVMSLGGVPTTYTRAVEDKKKQDDVQIGKFKDRLNKISDLTKSNKEKLDNKIAAKVEEVTEAYQRADLVIMGELDEDVRNLTQSIADAVTTVTQNYTEADRQILQELDDDVDALEQKISDDIATNNAKISGFNGGNIKINYDQNGKPYEILILNQDTELQATNCVRLNINGLGFGTKTAGSSNWAYVNAWTINGLLTASFITAVGSVTAGSIGGWTIGNDTISKQIDSTHSMIISATDGIKFKSGNNILRLNKDGIAFSNNNGSSYTTAWTVDGVLTASFINAVGSVTAGSIGGWTIGNNTISKQIDATHEMIISAAEGIKFKSGNNILRLSKDGIAFSKNGGSSYTTAWNVDGSLLADFITAAHLEVGTVGGWLIGETMLSNGQVGEDDYVMLSPTLGIQLGNDEFSVDKYGELVAKNAVVSGTVYATVFEAGDDAGTGRFNKLKLGKVGSECAIWSDQNALSGTTVGRRVYVKRCVSDSDYGFSTQKYYNGGSGWGIYPMFAALCSGKCYATEWNIWSDRRSKKNISEIDITSSMELILGLNPVSFMYKDENECTHHGFIAQDVEPLITDDWAFVSETDINQDKDGEPDYYKTISYTEVIADIVNVIKYQHNEIELLKERIARLEGN